MSDQEPAPDQIRMPDVKAVMEEAFPGCDVLFQHGIKSRQIELKFDEYELRVLLSGRSDEKRTANIRFIQRIERGKMRVFFERRTEDWKDVEGAIKEARAVIRGIIHSLNKAITPKKVHVQRELNDLFLGD